MRGVLWNLLGIVLCGGLGAVIAWWLTGILGLTGVIAAIVAVAVAMVAASAAWVALTVLLRKLGIDA